ncbi:hypothetical protein [Bacteroides sp.]|uniref:hypothetical protein n=1 Tax=Bacteroides sp. TaxID=29523 RepID=UPI00261D3786|nr:hypothetical protein [Bacteroides sp.]MDD3038606.1 hypothetical protein [Bacteroides sp.]
MKKFILLCLTVLLFCQCSKEKNIQSTISEVYGSEVLPKTEDGASIYVLNYTKKEDKQDKDIIRLKDKIDNITNSLSQNIGNDVSSKSDANTSATSKDDCLSDFYKWETPTIRVVLISRKCLENVRDITVIVTNKG